MPYCSQTLNGILLKRNTGFQSKKTLQLWLRWSDVKDPSKIVILILLSFQGPCWEIWEVCLNYSNWHFTGRRHPFAKKKLAEVLSQISLSDCIHILRVGFIKFLRVSFIHRAEIHFKLNLLFKFSAGQLDIGLSNFLF